MLGAWCLVRPWCLVPGVFMVLGALDDTADMQNVCLVIPCYNEAPRLNLPAFDAFMQQFPDVSFCFVNDGSQDGTLNMLRSLERAHPKTVSILDLPINAGKSEAVRRGMLHARAWRPFDYIGYWDVDLATPLAEVHSMWQLMQERPECLMVLGSRIKRLGASIERKPVRHYLGRVFATCASITLRLPVYDTQCGAKLVRADLVPSLFDAPFSSRWLFDVEVLARLRNLVGTDTLLAQTVEASLQRWQHVEGSKLTVSAMLRAPLELWRIARRYNRGLR